MILPLQVLVLAFTALLWWLAKRDLATHSSKEVSPAPDMAEWQRLSATLEDVLVALEARIDALEHKQEAAMPPPEPSASETNLRERDLLLPEDAHYASLYALADAGITDPEEIARRTGLTRGEIELALGLRARRML